MTHYHIFEAAAFLGVTFAARLAIHRPSTIEELLSRVDTDLALECCALGRDFNEKRWRLICTVRGLSHLICQASLLSRIVIEIRKEHPGELPEIKQLWTLAVRCLMERISMRLLPAAPWTYGQSCARTFVGIFQLATESGPQMQLT